MNSEQRAQQLRAQIEAALEESEIKEGLDQANLPADLAVERILGRESEIWDAASIEISEHERLVQELERLRADWHARLPRAPILPWRVTEAVVMTLMSALGLLILAAILLGLLALAQGIFEFQLVDFAAWWQSFVTLLGNLTTASALTQIWPFVLATIAVIAVVGSVFYRRIARRSDAWFALRRRTAEELGIPGMEKKEKEASEAIREALLEKGVKPALREIINDYMKPRYDMTLSRVNAEGLSEVFDPSYEISTPARRKLYRMIERLPGGSIGIAGPRGAGKTTLIRSFCRASELEIKGKPVLPVMMAAPTDYDSRDFLLHLFATVCQEVLNLSGLDGTKLLERQVTRSAAPSNAPHLGYGLRRAARFIMVVGLLLTGSAFMIASSVVIQQQREVQQAVVNGEGAAGAPDAADGSGDAAQQPAMAAAAGNPDGLQVLLNFIDVMGIKPGGIFLFGVTLALVGFAGTRLRRPRSDRSQDGSDPDLSGKPLAKEALKLLRDIKFQQSHTTGWSGSLKLPVGLGAGINQSSVLARQPLSVPEIVDKYQDFLELIVGSYNPIIGIDELDKMPSDEVAHRFLNEIKIIFGQAGIFYLVSVSESAISSFERRGLPFRDVFDSSFDDIIYVDYLDLASAKRLLLRRVIGMPVPFLCLCHCLSGGLARDLIRACRSVVDLASEEPNRRDIPTLGRDLISMDLDAKLRAVAIATSKLPPAAAVDRFSARLNELEQVQLTASSLLQMAEKLHADDAAEAEADAAHDDAEAAAGVPQDDVRRLRSELASFLLYCATLLKLFNSRLTKKKLKAAEGAGTLDAFTRSRQLLAVNPELARMKMAAYLKDTARSPQGRKAS